MKKLILSLLFFTGALVTFAEDAASPQADTKVASNPKLRLELLHRMDIDQQARKTLIDWSKAQASSTNVDKDRLSPEDNAKYEQLIASMQKIDSEDTQWLKDIVEKQGWPSKSMVGEDGANAAWLLVQHADANVRFQRRCLDLMAQLPKEEVSGQHVAYLTDRVLLAEGKKQIYGTQFDWVDGKLQPQPLEDEANVDKLRAGVDLPPLAEYAKSIEQMYGGEKK